MKSIVLCCFMLLVLGCAKKPIEISNSTSKESIFSEKKIFSEKGSDTYDYECEGGMVVKVKYITKDSSDLAIVSIPEQGNRIFVNTISASGSQYVSGEYTWWLKGDIVYFSQMGAKDIICRAID